MGSAAFNSVPQPAEQHLLPFCLILIEVILCIKRNSSTLFVTCYNLQQPLIGEIPTARFSFNKHYHLLYSYYLIVFTL